MLHCTVMHCTELKRTILFRADIPATGVSYIRESYTKKAISYSVFDLSLSRLIQFMHKLCLLQGQSRRYATVRVSFKAESANTRPLSFSNCAATDECIMTTGELNVSVVTATHDSAKMTKCSASTYQS